MPASAPLFPALIPAFLSASTDLARYRRSRPVSAATSKEQVNRSRQERHLTGRCCVLCSVLGWVWVVGGWGAALVLLLLGCVRCPYRFPVRSVLGWGCWRGLFWFPLVVVSVSGGLRFSARCCRFWFSNRQVKFLLFRLGWRVPSACFLLAFP